MRFHTPITVNQPTLISISPTPYSFTAQSPRFCAQSLHTPFHAHSTPFRSHTTPVDCIHPNYHTPYHGIPFCLHHSLSLLSSSYSTRVHLYSSHIYSYHFYNDSSLFTPNHSYPLSISSIHDSNSFCGGIPHSHHHPSQQHSLFQFHFYSILLFHFNLFHPSRVLLSLLSSTLRFTPLHAHSPPIQSKPISG